MTGKTQGSQAEHLQTLPSPTPPTGFALPCGNALNIHLHILAAAPSSVHTEHGGCYTCGEAGSRKQKPFAT